MSTPTTDTAAIIRTQDAAGVACFKAAYEERAQTVGYRFNSAETGLQYSGYGIAVEMGPWSFIGGNLPNSKSGGIVAIVLADACQDMSPERLLGFADGLYAGNLLAMCQVLGVKGLTLPGLGAWKPTQNEHN